MRTYGIPHWLKQARQGKSLPSMSTLVKKNGVFFTRQTNRSIYIQRVG